MCTVEKLLIKGIRSFSPTNETALDFEKPLALIVGHNGAGKTTIIECLKQVTTGSLPPNSKNGQSFIHDPKIAGETEVKAQIKCKLRTAQGTPIILQRSFILTQQKTKQTFKSLDGTIQTAQQGTGDLLVVSHKCAEMDKMIPWLMSVSRAILENVIFVHQEDSSWPLAESKPLKEKFDAIFAATKYTDALGRMRAMIKEKNQVIRESKLQLDHCKTHMDNASRLRRSLAEDSRMEAERTTRRSELLEAVAQLKQQKSELERELEEIQGKHDEIERKRLQLVSVKQTVETLAQHVVDQDANLSVEDMQADQEQLAQRQEKSKTKLAELQAAKTQKEQDLRQVRVALETAAARAVRLQTEVDAHRENVRKRDAHMRTMAAALGLDVSDLDQDPVPDRAQQSFHAELEARQASKQAALVELRGRLRAAEQQLQQQLSDISSRLNAQDANIRAKQTQLNEANARHRQVSGQMHSLALSSALDLKRDELAELRQEAERSDAARSLQDLGAMLQRLEGERAQGRAEVDRLRTQRTALALASQTATRLRMVRERLTALRKQEQGLLSDHWSILSQLLFELGLPAPANAADKDGVMRAVAQLLRQLQQEAAAAADDVQRLESAWSANAIEATALESQLAKVREESNSLAQKAVREMKDSAAWCVEVMEDYIEEQRDSVDSAVKQKVAAKQAAMQRLKAGVQNDRKPLNERHHILQENVVGEHAHLVAEKETIKAIQTFSNQWAGYAQREKCCAICRRPFATDAENEAFIHKCKEQGENAVESIDILEERIQGGTAAVQKAQQLVSSLQRHQQLEAERPVLEAQLQEVVSQRDATEQKLDQAKATKAANAAALATAQQLREKLLEPLQQMQWQIVKEEEDERRLIEKEGPVVVGDLRAAEKDLEAAEAHSRALDSQREAAIARRTQLHEDALKSKTRLMELEQEVAGLEAQVRQRAMLEDQLRELEERMSELQAGLRSLKEGHLPLRAEQHRLQARLDEQRDQGGQQETAASHAVTELGRQCDALAMLSETVLRFESGNVLTNAHAAQAKLEQQQAAVRDDEATVAALAGKISKQVAKVQQIEEIIRHGGQTISWLRERRKAEQLEAEVRAADAGGASANYQPKFDALNRCIADERAADNAVNVVNGELGVLRKRVADTKKELEHENFKDIDQKYRQGQVELKILEAGNRDLERYCKGLEKALLTFHSTKMEAINQSLKELWQTTYQGQDIDFIQIKADSSDSGRSSYNYRVIMYSAGAELDMRGRCSAGQKVLACILIRMALADTFSTTCGVIALDEPTTNLDAANSRALANALRRIIETRHNYGAESNRAFQLIVITHDERFATMLGTRQYAQNMTRVTKDANQHSCLTQEPVMAE